MRRLRGLIEGPYGRWIMLGLLIFILAIFTVTDEMTTVIRNLFGEKQLTQADTAGSFAILPGARVDISYADFDQAHSDYQTAASFFSQGAMERVHVSEVWTYLVLLEAAKREGVSVSVDEATSRIKQIIPPMFWDNPAQYKKWVRARFRTSPANFENAVRKLLTMQRVRELYWESYLVGPPATREEVVEQYAAQRIEFVRGHIAALDADRFLQQAADELKAESDPDAKLKDLFAKDPDVKNASGMFRNPRKYVLEVLYTIHKNLGTEEDVDRVVGLFSRAYPKLDVRKLDPSIKDMKNFFGIYRDRLLEQEGTSWRAVMEEYDEEKEDAAAPRKEGDEEGKDESGAGDEKAGAGDEKKETGDEKKETDEKEAELDSAVREVMMAHAYTIVKDQIARELRVRGMYRWFRDEAAENESKSLKVLFDKLREHDDKENPVCATEPGKGLIVYREFPDGLSGEELEEIEDSGVKFTHNYRARVTGMGDTDLPKLARLADVLGMASHGRQITRLLEVKRETRKTYEELTDGEKVDLREQFYLPSAARTRAKEALEALRKRCLDDQIAPEDFRAAAEKIGCRVHEDEWLEASYDFMAEPDELLYWPDEFLHMRDRHFLHKSLVGVLGRDTKDQLKAGSYLEVQVDAWQDAEDPGAAYLFLLLERKKPDASTVPPSEVNSFMMNFRRTRMQEEHKRWAEDIETLMADFKMEFYDDMQRRITDELKRRREAQKRAR
ncbi:MAG: SurA N-terminal domain-containing protein [Planctomycetota bacterium]